MSSSCCVSLEARLDSHEKQNINIRGCRVSAPTNNLCTCKVDPLLQVFNFPQPVPIEGIPSIPIVFLLGGCCNVFFCVTAAASSKAQPSVTKEAHQIFGVAMQQCNLTQTQMKRPMLDVMRWVVQTGLDLDCVQSRRCVE